MLGQLLPECKRSNSFPTIYALSYGWKMVSDPRAADNGLTVVILTWTLLIVSILVVSLRIYTRITRIRKVGADDYLMICSVVSTLLHELEKYY